MAETTNETIRIVTSLWRDTGVGYQLPKAVSYTLDHVRIMRNMLQRNMKAPYEFVLLTDDPKSAEGLEGVRVIRLWDKYRSLGGCYNRLYLFSKDMHDVIGPRFVHVDLDAVIVRDVTDVFRRRDPFAIHRYQPLHPGRPDNIQQGYNGGMIMMDAGAREEVWARFNQDPDKALAVLEKERGARRVVGTDQAWIRHVLGKGETTLGPEHGIYEYRDVKDVLPADAKMVFFAGKRDPSICRSGWVKKCYR
jgi:hypothetical protein